MENYSIKRYSNIAVLIIILLASLDLFRAYLEIELVNSIFALKELVLLVLFIHLCRKKNIKISNSILIVFIFSIFYCGINVVNQGSFILYFVFLKYLIVYYITYIVFDNSNLAVLQKAVNLLVCIFFIYSLISYVRLFLFSDSLFRSGRISGDANPSFLSYIYLLCFLYAFTKNKIFIATWFAIAGFLTLTKTYFVALVIIALCLIVFSSHRMKVLFISFIMTVVFAYVVTLNDDIFIAFDKALTVLLYKDNNEYNSFEDRISRISTFREENTGNFISGYGTGKASSASVFVDEKLGVKIDSTIDFENQMLNFYYSLGVLGLFMMYYPFGSKAWIIFNTPKGSAKYFFFLFLIAFGLYNMTLNILESYTTCIISLLFLFVFEKEFRKNNEDNTSK